MMRRLGTLAAGLLILACVDSLSGPGDHEPATARVQITIPVATPSVWQPIGETLHVSLRRAGRVEPIADTTFVITGALEATLTVPLSHAVERFVAAAELRYRGTLLFLGFEAVQFREGQDTSLTLATQYVGPGAGAATFELGARDSTIAPQDTASLIRVVRDSVGQVIPNVPARFVAARPAVITVDTAGILTAQGSSADTARVTGFLPTGQSGALILSVEPPAPPPPPPPPPPTVASVVVTPDADTITTVGGIAAFTAAAFDGSGAPMPAASFTWASANPAIATVDQNGVVTGGANGSTQITATSGGVSGSATIVVAVVVTPPPPPAPMTRTWIGGDATGARDWARAANWNPAGVPGVADSVIVDATANNPVLSGAVTIARLRILSDTLTLNGQTLTVTGDFSTEQGLGAIAMALPADTMRVQGTALFQGAPNTLEEGVLFVGGDFEQRNTVDNAVSFQARNGHRTILNGGAQQRLLVEGDARFAHLEIANTGGVRGMLEPNIEVEGTFKITTPVAFEGGDISLDVEDTVLTVAGSRLETFRMRLSGAMAVSGVYAVGRTVFNGEGQAIQPGLSYQDVEVEDSVHLSGPTTFAGYLRIIHGGNLTLDGRKLTVGSLDVGGPASQGLRAALLTLAHPADSLVVQGDAVFQSDTSSLSTGVILVAGIFGVARSQSFRAASSHRTVLNGSGSQFASVAEGARLGTFEVVNATGPVTVVVPGSEGPGIAMVNGALALRTPIVVDASFAAFDVADSVVTVAGSTLNVFYLAMRAGISLPGALTVDLIDFAGANQAVPTHPAYNHVRVSGHATLAGNMAWADAIIGGPGARLTLNGHRLTVGGAIAVGSFGDPTGVIVMTNAADSLIGTGEVVFSGASSAGLLTAGTVVVGGDFFSGEDPAAYQPSGSHRTVLNGAAQQRVRFDHPGATESRFNDLQLANSAGGIWMESALHVAGRLVTVGPAPAQVISGTAHHQLTVGGVDISRLSLDTIPLTILGGAITRFDSVTFTRQHRGGAQLSVTHPGAATPFTFTGLRFLATPTTGSYVNAADVAPGDGNVLTLVLDQSDPADGSSHTVTSGGAVVQWTGAPQPTWAGVSGGLSYSCAVRPDGGAYCWGSNFDGQLGDGTTMQRNVPTPVPAEATFASIAAGGQHTCAVVTDGVGACWGSNGYGELGDGTTNNSTSPVVVTGGFRFIAITAGEQHSCGITTAGAAYCWGRNGSGSLGDGTTTDRTTPTAVVGGHTFTSITAKFGYTCALTSAGAAYCWGHNLSGQLGNGTQNQSNAPQLVSGGLVFAMIAAASDHTCGVTTAGAAYCWGLNSFGQLGDGSTTQRLAPVAVSGGLTFASVSPGGNGFTCGRTTSGAAYCWGVNNVGQLGDGTSTQRATPVAVNGGLTFTAVQAGFAHVVGIVTGGAGYAWGGNTQGQLGDGSTTQRSAPVLITPP